METEVQQLPDLTEAAPEESATPAAEPAAPVSEEVVAESPEATPRSWETIRAEAEADETIKAEYEAHLEEVRGEGRKKGRSDVQERVENAVRASRAASQLAEQGVGEIKGLILKALNDGSITEQGLASALGTNAQAMYAYDVMRGVPSSTGAAKDLLTMLAGEDAQLAQRYAGRVDDLETGFDTKQAIIADFRDELVAPQVEAAKKPLQAKVRQLEAEIERLKADGRDGKGPSNASPAVASGITYDKLMSMTSAERTAVPAADKERLINEEQRRRSGG